MTNPTKQPNILVRIITAPADLYRRATAHLPLQPWERAALKLVNGFLLAGAAAGVDAVAQYLASQNINAINWQLAINIFITVGASGVLFAAQKWVSARGDFSLAKLLEDAGKAVEQGKAPAMPSTATILGAAAELPGVVNDIVNEPPIDNPAGGAQ